MRQPKRTNRPVVRLLSPLVIAALMWLPGVAQAEDATPPAPTTITTVLPLLGSNLTVTIVTEADGTVSSVTVGDQAVDFEQQDDEISFLFTIDGVTQTVTVEFGDDDQGDEADDQDESEIGDDDQGDEADDQDESEIGDDDQGDEADDNGDQGDEADDNGDQGDEADDHSQGSDEHEDDNESEGGE